jgi:hypothetical protein
MLVYLGRLLSARRRPLGVRYLSKAESAPAWRDGWLLAVDPQGASFASREHGGEVECLPWGSIGGIRIAEQAPAAGADADAESAERPAFFRAGAEEDG